MTPGSISGETVRELEERIARGATLHTELAMWPLHRDELAEALVALANTDGGRLILGVVEEGRIAGVEEPPAALRVVERVAHRSCDPSIALEPEVLHLGETEHPVVVLHVQKGDQRPYRTDRNIYSIRTTTGRRRASEKELLHLFRGIDRFYHDRRPILGLSLSALDLEAFEDFVETMGLSDLDPDRERLLRNWNLVENGHPTLAGVVLFGRQPQRHLPYAQINAARFPGTEDALEPSDRKDLSGRLLEVIERTEKFLNLHLANPHRIRGFEPEARPELPAEALREAVVNAVAHRDYTIRGPVRLFIFDDRIEIRTPGKPPNGVDEGSMRAGTHVVRNPTIYARLADAGLVTGAGTGIRRIIQLVREATGQETGLEIRESEVVLTIPRRRASG